MLNHAHAERQRPVPEVGIDRQHPSALLGDSDAFRYLLFRINEVAPTSATILLLGETGTGKTLIAREIHQRSSHQAGRFVAVNCAALPSTLLESELFGHERGAFTDAKTTQIGRLELADRGTIFLDEVGELPLESQAKLLRFLQDGEFERLGSARTVRVRVRVIAASNRDLEEEVRLGKFRRDLFFRLSVFPVTVPPLRERRRDIRLLALHFVERLARRECRRIDDVPEAVLDALERHHWPGNVRELENVLERAVITSHTGALGLDDTAMLGGDGPASDRMVDVERSHLLRVLSRVGWQVEGPTGAAAILGLRPSTLRSRMGRLGIHRPMSSLNAASRLES
jgi:formate hydrogenlyase transcriptional activator